MNPQKKRLLGLTLTELKAIVGSLGMPAFTAKQIAQWLYEKHVGSSRTVPCWLSNTR